MSYVIVTDLSKLKKKCEIIPLDEGIKIAKIVAEELEKNSSATGLAANQIGFDARVFAIKAKEKIYSFVNPEILELKDPILFKDEGCLSLPGKRINTIRFNFVKIKDDINKVLEFENFAAIAIQHEFDHIEGKLMKEADLYSLCPCGSGKKFKFCHMR